jgi:hypothetical protein
MNIQERKSSPVFFIWLLNYGTGTLLNQVQYAFSSTHVHSYCSAGLIK